MQIHLKRGEKIYINGAVLRLDRRASLEFLNDVDFLLETHVMQAEAATTPLRRLYFVVQTMLIDPPSSGMTQQLYIHLSHRLRQQDEAGGLCATLDATDAKVATGRYFEVLKLLRACFEPEAGTAPSRGEAA